LTITLNSAGNLTSAVIANRGKGYASGDTVGLLGLSGHTGSIVQITAVASVGSVAPAIGIETGWTYTVIDDGTFYGEIVRIGDVLIAESDDPGNLENWTTVQNNIDLASLTQVGIGNVIAATADDLLGMNVAYSGGTATVGLNITGLNAITTTDDTSELAIYDEDNTTNKKISVGNLALAGNSGTSKKGEIAIGDLTETVTVPATWGFDTMVQTRNAAGDTVFCDVTRTATSVTATMSTAQTALTGGIITILVQKIG
jgi:hypothetical protein